jgi:purine-binding chemotaxis protein CheW
VASDSTQEPYLLCKIESRVCAIPLLHVSETMRPLPIEPLAGVPTFVLGIAIIRGAATPVVDTGKLIGGRQLRATRFVTIKMGERYVALAVDSVLGIRSLSRASLAGVPPLLGVSSADSIVAMGSLDAELLLVLEATRVVPESVWNAIKAARAQP